jgi:hypothetical protein
MLEIIIIVANCRSLAQHAERQRKLSAINAHMLAIDRAYGI